MLTDDLPAFASNEAPIVALVPQSGRLIVPHVGLPEVTGNALGCFQWVFDCVFNGLARVFQQTRWVADQRAYKIPAFTKRRADILPGSTPKIALVVEKFLPRVNAVADSLLEALPE